MTVRDYEIELELIRLRTARRRRKFFLGLVAWCIVLWAVFYFFFGIAVVEGNSMRPAFLPGDIVLYKRGTSGGLSCKDVVLVDTALHETVIKRIAGLPGDVIDVDGKGHLTRNGEAVREPEVLFGDQTSDTEISFPFMVPEGEYFFLGDNRPVSLDSRVLGTAGEEDIRGKVVALFRAGAWAGKTR